MKSTKEERQWAHRLYESSFTKGRLDDKKVSEVANTIVEKKPRGAKGILHYYYRLVKLEEEKYHALVESATSLSEELSKEVESYIKKKHGDSMSVEFKINPELLGGLKIRVSDDVFDGSVLNRINKLKKQFNQT